MGFPRIVFVLTGFGILSCISIYWSFLQEQINSVSEFQEMNEIVVSGERRPPPKMHYLQDIYKKIHLKNHTAQTSHCTNCSAINQTNSTANITEQSKATRHKRKLWISMGLCFSKNTEMYGKRYYPYDLVTPLAILLWYHFFPDINVILYLIYDKNEIDDRRKLYEEQLRQTNVEIRWIKSGDMSCVTKSQVIRTWAFQEPMIEDNDIIITVDVNLFVATTEILKPIFDNPDLKIWVFQWHNVAFVETGIGETFNQNLISAESKGNL